jgi:hypothetical protein
MGAAAAGVDTAGGAASCTTNPGFTYLFREAISLNDQTSIKKFYRPVKEKCDRIVYCGVFEGYFVADSLKKCLHGV